MLNTKNTQYDYLFSHHFSTFDLETGVTKSVLDVREISLTSDFLKSFWKGIYEECDDAVHEIMYICGNLWGKRYAPKFEKALQKINGKGLNETPMAVFNECLKKAFQGQGWGILRLNYDYQAKGLIIAEMDFPIIAQVIEAKKINKPVEDLTAGVLAGMFSYFTEQNLSCLQTTCISYGAKNSRFVITLKERIDQLKASWPTPHEQIIEELISISAG